jgi:hypothetical protein
MLIEPIRFESFRCSIVLCHKPFYCRSALGTKERNLTGKNICTK